MKDIKIVLNSGVEYKVVNDLLVICGNGTILKEGFIDCREDENFYILTSECCRRIIRKKEDTPFS